MMFTPPSTTHMGISDARARLTSVVNEVYRGETRVVVERSGIAVAAFVSPADLAKLVDLDRRESRLFELIREMERAFVDVPEEELIRQAALSIAEVREEMAAEGRAREDVQARRAAVTTDQLVGVRE